MKKAILGLTVTTAALAAVATTSAASGNPFKVSSTLDGKTALPHRVLWIATTTLPSSRITQVDFLIDGKVRWIEHQAPYVYGGDSGSHRAYLVTSFLSPGKHKFAIRAIASNGSRATDHFASRVPASPIVPGALAGTWKRTIDTSAAPKGGAPEIQPTRGRLRAPTGSPSIRNGSTTPSPATPLLAVSIQKQEAAARSSPTGRQPRAPSPFVAL